MPNLHAQALEELELVQTDAIEDEEEYNPLSAIDEMCGFVKPELLSSAAKKLLESEVTVETAEYLLDSMGEDDEALQLALQSQLIYGVGEFTVSQLLQGSQHQSQFGVQPGKVSSILADTRLGLVKCQQLLEPFEVVLDYVTDEPILKGGHHRLAAMVALVEAANPELQDWVNFLKQRVVCYTVRVSPDAELEALTGETDRVQVAMRLQAMLWLSSNGSRAVTQPEKQNYGLYKLGIDPTDVSSFISLSWLKDSDKMQLVFRANLVDYTDTVDDPIALDLSPHLEDYSFSTKTLSDLASSFFSNLKKIKAVQGEDEKAIFEKDLRDPLLFEEMVERLVEPRQGKRTLLEAALIEQISSPDGDGTNVARGIAKGGAALARLYSEVYSPKYDVFQKKKTATTTKGKRSRRRV